MSRVRPTSSRDKEYLDTAHTCRVCLNPQTQDNPLLQLCLCRGSIRFQHANCANTWLQSHLRTKKPSDLQDYALHGYPCEICHHPIPIHLRQDLHCSNWQDVKQAASEQKCVAVTYVVVGMLVVVFLGVTLWLELAQRELGIVGEENLMVVIAMVLEVVLLLVVVGLFVRRFVVRVVLLGEVELRKKELQAITTRNALDNTLNTLQTSKP